MIRCTSQIKIKVALPKILQ